MTNIEQKIALARELGRLEGATNQAKYINEQMGMDYIAIQDSILDKIEQKKKELGVE